MGLFLQRVVLHLGIVSLLELRMFLWCTLPLERVKYLELMNDTYRITWRVQTILPVLVLIGLGKGGVSVLFDCRNLWKQQSCECYLYFKSILTSSSLRTSSFLCIGFRSLHAVIPIIGISADFCSFACPTYLTTPLSVPPVIIHAPIVTQRKIPFGQRIFLVGLQAECNNMYKYAGKLAFLHNYNVNWD